MIDEKFKDIVPMMEQAIQIIGHMGIRIETIRDCYVRIKLPFEPNKSHIATVYAGSLFALAEYSGGAVFLASFDRTRYYPIAKEMSIKFRRMAKTDMHVEVEMPPELVRSLCAEVEEKGKADFNLEVELKDENDELCCTASGIYQIRKWPHIK